MPNRTTPPAFQNIFDKVAALKLKTNFSPEQILNNYAYFVFEYIKYLNSRGIPTNLKNTIDITKNDILKALEGIKKLKKEIGGKNGISANNTEEFLIGLGDFDWTTKINTIQTIADDLYSYLQAIKNDNEKNSEYIEAINFWLDEGEKSLDDNIKDLYKPYEEKKLSFRERLKSNNLSSILKHLSNDYEVFMADQGLEIIGHLRECFYDFYHNQELSKFRINCAKAHMATQDTSNNPATTTTFTPLEREESIIIKDSSDSEEESVNPVNNISDNPTPVISLNQLERQDSVIIIEDSSDDEKEVANPSTTTTFTPLEREESIIIEDSSDNRTDGAKESEQNSELAKFSIDYSPPHLALNTSDNTTMTISFSQFKRKYKPINVDNISTNGSLNEITFGNANNIPSTFNRRYLQESSSPLQQSFTTTISSQEPSAKKMKRSAFTDSRNQGLKDYAYYVFEWHERFGPPLDTHIDGGTIYNTLRTIDKFREDKGFFIDESGKEVSNLIYAEDAFISSIADFDYNRTFGFKFEEMAQKLDLYLNHIKENPENNKRYFTLLHKIVNSDINIKGCLLRSINTSPNLMPNFSVSDLASPLILCNLLNILRDKNEADVRNNRNPYQFGNFRLPVADEDIYQDLIKEHELIKFRAACFVESLEYEVAQSFGR